MCASPRISWFGCLVSTWRLGWGILVSLLSPHALFPVRIQGCEISVWDVAILVNLYTLWLHVHLCRVRDEFPLGCIRDVRWCLGVLCLLFLTWGTWRQVAFPVMWCHRKNFRTWWPLCHYNINNAWMSVQRWEQLLFAGWCIKVIPDGPCEACLRVEEVGETRFPGTKFGDRDVSGLNRIQCRMCVLL